MLVVVVAVATSAATSSFRVYEYAYNCPPSLDTLKQAKTATAAAAEILKATVGAITGSSSKNNNAD